MKYLFIFFIFFNLNYYTDNVVFHELIVKIIP